VTKMSVIRIKDLAEVMIKELAPGYGYAPEEISINIIGTKPGEKLYEELMTGEETRRTLELPRYFAVTPAFSSLYKDVQYQYPEVLNRQVDNPYNSANEQVMGREELKEFLYSNKLLEGEAGEGFEPDKRFWGDEKK